MTDGIFLETPRMIINYIDPSHAELHRVLQKDPQVMRFMGGPRDDHKIAAVFDLLFRHQQRYGFSAGTVFLKETGEFMGRSGIVHLDFQDTPDVELARFLMPVYWVQCFGMELGQALIDYAFNVLNKPRIFGTVDPGNIAAYHTLEKLGMTLDKVDTYKTLDKPVRFYVKYATDSSLYS